MVNSNNVAIIAVSDEDPEDPGRVRTRVRRRRKKPQGQRAVRFLLRYWGVLVFLLLAGLLLFEASRIGGAREGGSGPGPPPKKPSDGNLNRLDPTTHVVGGVRERCLKIIPPEELERLDVRIRGDIGGPVRSLVYVTGAGAHEGTESGLSGQAARFNLFTGYQTFEEREMSFKVKETANVHCGFYSEAGGFRISEEDRRYMEACMVVVSTCAFGGGDDLYQPIGMSEASLRKVCYVAFWDEVTLGAQESAGHNIGEDGYIGKWRIIIVKDLPFSDQRLNGKIPKMLAHRLFPKAKYSIWVDSKSQFRRDPLGVLEALLWRTDSVLAISEHGARSSIYDEAKAVVKKHKATPEEVAVQLAQYRQDGMPEDKRLNGKKALNEASVIIREHTPMTNLFMCLWFNEAVRFTSRDQLSFPYVLWRLKGPKNINMFPVCTRKDMLNSMGHLRKAKPLGQ